MKICRFGWLLAWSACMATGLSSDRARAGNIARAKARLTTTTAAESTAKSEPSAGATPTTAANTAAPSAAADQAPILTAAKPTNSPTPAPAAVPTVAPKLAPATSPAASVPAPVVTPVSTPATSPLRGTTESPEPTDGVKPYRNVLREPASTETQQPLRSAETSSTPTAAASTPAAVSNPSVDTSRPTTTPATTPSTTTATPSPADTSPPSRTRPQVQIGDDTEPGAPLDQQKSTIGRTPPDENTRKMFESEEEKPLTPELVALRQKVQQALALYHRNWTLNTRDHSPWEVMHAIVAYGVDTRLYKGPPGSETTTAIGHLCFSGVCKNQPILTIRNGELYALRGPGVQGHSGQFLAILAQSCLQRDYPLYVGGEKFTLEDLIEAEQRDCEAGTELTFKLISLMHYLPSDAKWTNFQGQPWSLDRLVREEIVQPIRGAACGGTHRLMGLSYAVRKREQRGEPITGIYLEARKYIDQYHKYTFSLQNPDGSFSTSWFVRREARLDLDRRLQTSGHILEWLCFSLSDEQLRDPRVVKAVNYIATLLLNEKVSAWEVGHLGHALHALQIYNERTFGGPIRSFESLVTKRPLKTAQRPAPLVREAPDAAPRGGIGGVGLR